MILPKQANVSGGWALAMIVGSIRLTLVGNRYQSSLSIVELIPSNASPILWPSSQAMNTVMDAKIPFKINNIRGIMFPWCACKQCDEVSTFWETTENNLHSVMKFESTQLFVFEWWAMRQRSPKNSTWKVRSLWVEKCSRNHLKLWKINLLCGIIKELWN